MLIAHPASAGHGLNLQQGGHIIVWLDLHGPWNYTNKQMLDYTDKDKIIRLLFIIS
ncbi:putative DNA helicase [Staphylococcus aureus]|nr:putative DNA helicase [Staphylococcus aureus]